MKYLNETRDDIELKNKLFKCHTFMVDFSFFFAIQIGIYSMYSNSKKKNFFQ